MIRSKPPAQLYEYFVGRRPVRTPFSFPPSFSWFWTDSVVFPVESMFWRCQLDRGSPHAAMHEVLGACQCHGMTGMPDSPNSWILELSFFKAVAG